MKISVVTISFNQAKYLRECMDSVLNQDYSDIEYIVVDPGSTDGSREIIESYGDRVIKVFEKDAGAADGLNKGFATATGSIYCYLNSDDTFLPGAFSTIIQCFNRLNGIDILCGHAFIIDAQSKKVRKVYSDSFNLKAVAYGAVVSIQPSTFFKRQVFAKCGGFNIMNKSNWDGELLIDMALAGASICVLNNFLSCYRVHSTSITGTGRLNDAHTQHSKNMFVKIFGREQTLSDRVLSYVYRLKKHLTNPYATIERLRYGRVFGSVK